MKTIMNAEIANEMSRSRTQRPKPGRTLGAEDGECAAPEAGDNADPCVLARRTELDPGGVSGISSPIVYRTAPGRACCVGDRVLTRTCSQPHGQFVAFPATRGKGTILAYRGTLMTRNLRQNKSVYRTLTVAFLFLVTLSVSAQWAAPQDAADVPAFNSGPPAKGSKLPALLTKADLWGADAQYPFQTHAYELAAKIPAVLHQQPG